MQLGGIEVCWGEETVEGSSAIVRAVQVDERREVLYMPHRFLTESGDSAGVRRNPEESNLAGGPAKLTILVIPHSSGIEVFRN